jgi:hypothetical protein
MILKSIDFMGIVDNVVLGKMNPTSGIEVDLAQMSRLG